MNRQYRCYFTDANDKIQSVEQIMSDDDVGAALQVDRLLVTSKHESAELWQSNRLVGKWANAKKLG
jgi:hypothetical protein